MAQLYKVKLAQGFNAGGRRRAGIYFVKGVAQIMPLTQDQLETLQNDVWVEVNKTNKSNKITPPSVPIVENLDTDTEEEIDLSTKNFKELQAIATELDLDTTGLNSKAKIIKCIEESQEIEE